MNGMNGQLWFNKKVLTRAIDRYVIGENRRDTQSWPFRVIDAVPVLDFDSFFRQAWWLAQDSATISGTGWWMLYINTDTDELGYALKISTMRTDRVNGDSTAIAWGILPYGGGTADIIDIESFAATSSGLVYGYKSGKDIELFPGWGVWLYINAVTVLTGHWRTVFHGEKIPLAK